MRGNGKRDVHYEGWIVLRTPLQHGGDRSFGTTRLFRAQKVVCEDERGVGVVRKIPVYSGNAVRGVFRDLAAEQLFRTLGVAVPPHVFDFFTSGGSLTTKGTTVDLGLARRLREVIPMVGLFGGGVGNQILEGKLIFLQGMPICRETLGILPSYCVAAPSANLSIRDLRQFEFGVRRDDKKRENWQPMLEGPAPAKRDDEAAAQMKYETETLAPGSCLRFGFIGKDLTEAEWRAFLMALIGFLARPFLGGRAAAGYGEVAVPALHPARRLAQIAADVQLDTSQALATIETEVDREQQLEVLAGEIESSYVADVATRREEILDSLSWIK